MFRPINIMLIRGAQRHLYEAPLCCNKYSFQLNPKTIAVWSQKKKQKTTASKEASALVVSEKQLNSRESLKMMKENRKNDIEQMSTGPFKVTEYSQEATKVNSQIPKDDTKLKLSRRDFLRQMYKDNRMNLIEKKPSAGKQMDSAKSTKEFLSPARLEFVNLMWKERQEEIEKRKQETDKKYVSRFEMNAGRKERII
ncbi:uncharacterized protein LOC117584171 [Drosophila guanche]|nr:uncharacterized protein LOC117584171 [Drosophila guanche]